MNWMISSEIKVPEKLKLYDGSESNVASPFWSMIIELSMKELVFQE